MKQLVARAVDLVVFMKKENGKRVVSEIVEVFGVEGDEQTGFSYKTKHINDNASNKKLDQIHAV